jgi:hypothetical protein
MIETCIEKIYKGCLTQQDFTELWRTIDYNIDKFKGYKQQVALRIHEYTLDQINTTHQLSALDNLRWALEN